MALSIIKSNTQLHIHTDMFGREHKGIIDAGRLKKLTSALKDISDILQPSINEDEEDNSFIEALKGKTEDVWNEEKE